MVFLFLSVKFKVDIHAFDDCVTDGGNDLGVDAIYITRMSDGPEIHVIQSKFHDSERKAGNAFKTSAMHKFRDFLRTVKNREADLDALANPVLKDRILEIRELLADESSLL
ncbi:MAG: hypothetical protein CMK06_00660 [Ponticaulis sp.]|nr:hypothetical protein [Ponticaulis sp.]